jgi:hypothetical protein
MAVKYPSAQDIEEMKARGYDASTIAAEIELSKRGLVSNDLKQRIQNAFSGVKLGARVGLREAQGLDDYASPEKCAAYRATDEKLDWQAIRPIDLNECHSSLSFFDADLGWSIYPISGS